MELGRRDRVESRGADKDRIGDSQGALKLLESFKFRYETQTERELAKESGLYRERKVVPPISQFAFPAQKYLQFNQQPPSGSNIRGTKF